MTSGPSMYAMIRVDPPQAEQVSILISKTRLMRCAQVTAAKCIDTSAIGAGQNAEWCGSTDRSWPVALVAGAVLTVRSCG